MRFELSGGAAHPDPQKGNRLAHLEWQPLRLPGHHLLWREVGEAHDAAALLGVAGLARNHKGAALAHDLVEAQVDCVAPVGGGGLEARGRPRRQQRARRVRRVRGPLTATGGRRRCQSTHAGSGRPGPRATRPGGPRWRPSSGCRRSPPRRRIPSPAPRAGRQSGSGWRGGGEGGIGDERRTVRAVGTRGQRRAMEGRRGTGQKRGVAITLPR